MQKGQAILLRKIELNEKDLLLIFLTPDWGKIKVKAVGARKPISKMAPFLDYFSLLEISFTGKQEIKVLTGVKLIQNFSALRQDFQKANFGYFLLEITEKSLALEKPQKEEIFTLLKTGLEKLNQGSQLKQYQKIIFLYSLKLFYALGYLKDYKIRKSELANLIILKPKVQKIFQEVLEKNLKSWEALDKMGLL